MADNTDADVASRSPQQVILTVFVPFTLGYFLSYLYRNVNSVLFPYFEADVGISAGGLGLLTAAYFLSFAAFQLPLGMLLDRFGPRRVEASLLSFAALGAVVFAGANSVGGLFAGRLLIGLGVSGCLMAAFKANVIWWPADRLPLVNGLFMLSGGAGAMVGTAPVAALVTVVGWRQMFRGLAGLTLLTAVVLLVVVPEREPRPATGGTSTRGAADSPARLGAIDSMRGVWHVWTSPRFWEVAPATVLVHGAFINYQGFWAGPWLRDVAGLGASEVATWVFATAACLTVGYACSALAADRLRHASFDPLRVTIGFMVVVLGTEAALVALPAVWSPYLWCLFAFSGTGTIISYAVLSQAYPPALSGRVTTALNLIVFSAVFLLQSGVGWVVDRFEPAAGQVYAAAGHRVALASLLALQAPAVGWLIYSRCSRR